MTDEGGLRNISDTAHWVAFRRALECERPTRLDSDISVRGFFVPVARVKTCCYVVFGKELFRDCSEHLKCPT